MYKTLRHIAGMFMLICITTVLSACADKVPKQVEQPSLLTYIPNVQAYVRAYPDWIEKVDGNDLVWKDGERMPIKLLPEPTYQKALDDPDLYTQLFIRYPVEDKVSETSPPGPFSSDSGRVRYIPFFLKMYGSSKEEVAKNLVDIQWLPLTFGKAAPTLRVTTVNGVADKIRAISDELDNMVMQNPELKKYLENPGGTFNWRFIAGTTRPSAHSFGMTIDINVGYSNYWLWDYKKKRGLDKDVVVVEADIPLQDYPVYRNHIPQAIVEVFEKYHFIWGGKWYLHYDTMHFEYRPELFM